MAIKIDSSVNQRFSSRIGLILSAMGIAVGTGNIWRFPRIAAQSSGENGAGAFLVAWLIFLFLWSIPLIIAEYTLGKKHRQGTVGIFMAALGKKFAWAGSFVGFVSTAITFFYAVVIGWCIYYFVHYLFTPLPLTMEASMETWNHYQNSLWPFVTHILAIGFGALVIRKGINSIEKVNKILIPVLLLIVVLSVIRALTLPGAWEGVAWLFTPDWSQLKEPRIWISALTQNAFDTGAGWGLFLTYAAYMKSEHGTVKNAFLTAIGNNTVSLLSGIMIFGTVFAVLRYEMSMAGPEILNVMKSSGPASTGLTFIWMPQLFARMGLGSPISVLFFLGLSFAGFSSLVAQMELPTRILIDTGIKRTRATGIVVAVIYIMGIPSAYSLNFLSNQDFVWSVALMISGAFIAIAVIKTGLDKLIMEMNKNPNDWKAGSYWKITINKFIPIAAVFLLFWWLYLSATEFAPDQWYNPLNPFSIMSCLLQWIVVAALFILFNSRIAEKMKFS